MFPLLFPRRVQGRHFSPTHKLMSGGPHQRPIKAPETSIRTGKSVGRAASPPSCGVASLALIYLPNDDSGKAEMAGENTKIGDFFFSLASEAKIAFKFSCAKAALLRPVFIIFLWAFTFNGDSQLAWPFLKLAGIISAPREEQRRGSNPRD